MKKVPNRKVKVKLNKIILQVLLLILVSIALITQKDSILNILTNKSKIKAGIPAGMKVGDIIKYDHKTGVDPSLLKTTIGKGTASIPGSGRYLYTRDPVQEQTFDASTIDTTWHVWSIDRDKDEIMIVSDNVAPFKTYGAIDYIWYEHNMHKIASIFGHGKGAKKKAFTYKVGSQLEDTGDTATWTTGTNGVPLTGTRPLRTEDIEKAFGWTESDIKTDSKFTRYGDNWGGTTTLNINYPQRKVEGINQTWDNEEIAKGPKKNVTAYNRVYYISKSNVPEGMYRNILWDWNGNNYVQLGQVGLVVYSGDVNFSRGLVDSDRLNSALWNFVNALNDGRCYEFGYPGFCRVVAFLSSSDIVYRKSSAVGTHQEDIWEMADKKTLPQGMKIGDIVNYDHKATGVKIEDSRLSHLGDNQDLLKTTIEKGTASTPGSTYKQDFDGNKIDTKWRVWGVDEETGDVIILSDNVAPFKTYGAIDYIWYEHNMHQIASIFGHGKGAKKKEFTYKVGSQLEDTGDTATWITGTNGVPLTGARPLKTKDIEDVFGWTESNIKSNSNFGKNSGSNSGYGGIYTKNIYFPQRDIGSNVQQWTDKNTAKAAKQDVKGKDGWYYINKSNVPEGTYRNILWDWNDNKTYQLGKVGLDVGSSNVSFRRGVVYSDTFSSSRWYFANAGTGGYWGGAGNTGSGRVVAFLSSSDIVYRKSSAFGAHQEGIWDIELKSPATKNVTVNVKNMTGKTINNGEVKLSNEGANTVVLSTGKVSFTKDKEYTLTKSGVIMKDNNYKMYVEGLPEGLDYKILSHYNEKESGKTHTLEQDILSFEKEDVTYDIMIYPKDGKYIVPVTYVDGEHDGSFAVKGTLTLTEETTNKPTMQMRSATPVSSPANKSYTKEDVELKPGITNVEFDNVKLFDEETNELKKYKLEFTKTSSDNHEVEITEDNKIIVRYKPPQKEISIKTSLVLLDETTKIPVTLVADKVDKGNVKTTEIELNKSSGYEYSKAHPVNITNGESITYTLDTSKIDKSKYITNVEKGKDKDKIEFVLTIRPVLTLPMSGSDSMKVMGITLGICTLAGFTVRARNKWLIFLKKYEIMK